MVHNGLYMVCSDQKRLNFELINNLNRQKMNKIKALTRYTLYTLLAVVLLASCNVEPKKELEYKIIYSKSYFSFTNNQLENNVCRFFYKKYEKGSLIEFSDKCDKYNVGDTIVGVARNYL